MQKPFRGGRHQVMQKAGERHPALPAMEVAHAGGHEQRRPAQRVVELPSLRTAAPGRCQTARKAYAGEIRIVRQACEQGSLDHLRMARMVDDSKPHGFVADVRTQGMAENRFEPAPECIADHIDRDPHGPLGKPQARSPAWRCG